MLSAMSSDVTVLSSLDDELALIRKWNPTQISSISLKLEHSQYYFKSEVMLTAYVQSWPKVLRMTQIYIFTKFAASVSRYFCQMLLWNTEV